eukprot:jgi/Mesvir1/2126/Mv16653-RA.1
MTQVMHCRGVLTCQPLTSLNDGLQGCHDAINSRISKLIGCRGSATNGIPKLDTSRSTFRLHCTARVVVNKVVARPLLPAVKDDGHTHSKDAESRRRFRAKPGAECPPELLGLLGVSTSQDAKLLLATLNQKSPAAEDGNQEPSSNDFGTEKQLTALVKRLGESPTRWGRALLVVEWLINEGLPLSPYLLTVSLSICGRHGQVDRARALFAATMESRTASPTGGLPSPHAVTNMIKCLSDGGAWEEALQLLDELRAAGFEPNAHVLTAALGACTVGQQGGRARAMFHEIKSLHAARTVRADVILCTACISAFARTGQWQDAEEVLAWMREQGLRPNAYTLSAYITCLGGAGQFARAQEAFHQIPCQRNEYVYSALIKALGDSYQWKEAAQVFRSMEREGVKPNLIAYSSLLHAYEKVGHWQDAMLVFEAARARGIAPNTVMYNALISACGKAGKWELAEALFESMEAAGAPHDDISYASLIAACGYGGKWAKAMQLLNATRRKGLPLTDYAFVGVINALGEAGRCRQAAKLVAAMPSMGCQRTVHVYNALILAYQRVGAACSRPSRAQSASSWRRCHLHAQTRFLRIFTAMKAAGCFLR